MFNLARSTQNSAVKPMMAAALIKNAVKANNLMTKSRCISSVVPSTNLKDFQTANEPVYEYKKGSPERKALEEALKRTAAKCEEVPIVIGGKEIRTDQVVHQVMPHNHQHKLAKFYYADSKTIKSAIKTAVETQPKWDRVPLSERLKIWDKATDLMAGKYRQDLNAATMLGQAKTIIQAEIDSAAELIDFIRLNAFFLKECANISPLVKI